MEEKTYEVDSNHHEFRRDSVIKDEIKENVIIKFFIKIEIGSF